MILIVDDDSLVRSSLSFLLKRAGYETELASSPEEALVAVRKKAPDLVLMDMNFSISTTGEEGIELLQKVKILSPDSLIILITAWGSISLAVRGMRMGAFDFIAKPWDNMQLLKSIETALSLRKTPAMDSLPTGRRELDSKYDFGAIIGKSDQIISTLSTVARVARTNASVLITGESGTGKELIAEAIHRNSRRANKPFIKVNLGGISQSLFESEMFGHKRGAFTDAHSDRIGRFQMADGGTIFLDEIGELDLACQVKLLRVLQDQSFEVLGESVPRKVDVRVICATNADLGTLIKERLFREDLYYRINLITVNITPLRERREDIPLLIDFFASKLCRQNDLPVVTFTQSAIDYLCKLHLSGNVRELRNIVERAILICDGSTIDLADVEPYGVVEELVPASSRQRMLTLDEIEELSIREALSLNKGNLSQSAIALGLSRAALYRRLEKYNIQHDSCD